MIVYLSTNVYNCILYFSYSKLKNTITVVTELLLQDNRDSYHGLTECILGSDLSSTESDLSSIIINKTLWTG